jgi:prevent-host-death family protein
MLFGLEVLMAVNYKNDIKPISYIKTNAAEMMKYVNERRNPIIITQNGEARAVLMDIDSYQNMQNAFSLLSIIKISEDEIKRGEYQTSDDAFNEIEKKYFK